MSEIQRRLSSKWYNVEVRSLDQQTVNNAVEWFADAGDISLAISEVLGIYSLICFLYLLQEVLKVVALDKTSADHKRFLYIDDNAIISCPLNRLQRTLVKYSFFVQHQTSWRPTSQGDRNYDEQNFKDEARNIKDQAHPTTREFLKFTDEKYDNLPVVSSVIVGFDLDKVESKKFLDQWFHCVQKKACIAPDGTTGRYAGGALTLLVHQMQMKIQSPSAICISKSDEPLSSISGEDKVQMIQFLMQKPTDTTRKP